MLFIVNMWFNNNYRNIYLYIFFAILYIKGVSIKRKGVRGKGRGGIQELSLDIKA